MYIGGLIKQNITLALQKKSVVLASLKKVLVSKIRIIVDV